MKKKEFLKHLFIITLIVILSTLYFLWKFSLCYPEISDNIYLCMSLVTK